MLQMIQIEMINFVFWEINTKSEFDAYNTA